MSLSKLSFVTIFFLFVIQFGFAQRNYDDYNKLGLTGGITLFDISTTDLVTEQGTGFTGGFTARGAFRNQFDLIYGINFINSNIGVAARDITGLDQQSLEYTIQGVQINFLGSYNIIRHHLSIEFGPLLQVNGKMKLQSERFEGYIIDGYNTITARDIEDISKVNFRVLGGITAGIEGVRLSAQYQYGVSNMLSALNDKNLENTNFEGNSSTIVLGAAIYF
ncbi:outer membrane beta-barrel protein [Patiriisocius hiemis]|uniref:Outer membrane beta-barrel protein n=1 Tax=Patiriisocius hiemis TaxID=3075604 RepID=A0ABU2YBM7_9FLAO|nr:outer membrane beta-barrel protein [Constantimarinum sp. W242]MDT0555590.1 outer membrane beta-barrel protein [Constantimarinum sp. W242]